MKLPSPGLWCVGSFLMTASISTAGEIEAVCSGFLLLLHSVLEDCTFLAFPPLLRSMNISSEDEKTKGPISCTWTAKHAQGLWLSLPAPLLNTVVQEAPVLHSGLCSNVTSLERPFLGPSRAGPPNTCYCPPEFNCPYQHLPPFSICSFVHLLLCSHN